MPRSLLGADQGVVEPKLGAVKPRSDVLEKYPRPVPILCQASVCEMSSVYLQAGCQTFIARQRRV